MYVYDKFFVKDIIINYYIGTIVRIFAYILLKSFDILFNAKFDLKRVLFKKQYKFQNLCFSLQSLRRHAQL